CLRTRRLRLLRPRALPRSRVPRCRARGSSQGPGRRARGDPALPRALRGGLGGRARAARLAPLRRRRPPALRRGRGFAVGSRGLARCRSRPQTSRGRARPFPEGLSSEAAALMLKIARLKNILDPHDQELQIAPHEGKTIAELAPRGFRHGFVEIDGIRIDRERWSEYRPRDGANVLFVDTPAGDVVALGIALAAAFFVSSLIQAKFFRPVQPTFRADQAAEERTPARVPQAVQTSVGAGHPIPFVYGRTRVGGQIIESFETPDTTFGTIDDEFTVVPGGGSVSDT